MEGTLLLLPAREASGKATTEKSKAGIRYSEWKRGRVRKGKRWLPCLQSAHGHVAIKDILSCSQSYKSLPGLLKLQPHG